MEEGWYSTAWQPKISRDDKYVAIHAYNVGPNNTVLGWRHFKLDIEGIEKMKELGILKEVT